MEEGKPGKVHESRSPEGLDRQAVMGFIRR